MTNLLQKIIWIIFIGLGLFIAYSVFKAVNTPDYRAELIQTLPMELRVEFKDANEYLDESTNTARKYIFSVFEDGNGNTIHDRLYDFGYKELVEYKSNNIYFTYEITDSSSYELFLNRVNELKSLEPSNQREAISLAFYYNLFNLRERIKPVEFIEEVKVNPTSISFRINPFFLKIPKNRVYRQFVSVIKEKYLIGFDNRKRMLGFESDDLGSLRGLYDSATYMNIYTTKENAKKIEEEFTSNYFEFSSHSSVNFFDNLDGSSLKWYYDRYVK